MVHFANSFQPALILPQVEGLQARAIIITASPFEGQCVSSVYRHWIERGMQASYSWSDTALSSICLTRATVRWRLRG